MSHPGAYLSITKFIDELISSGTINENDCLQIYFTDFYINSAKQRTFTPDRSSWTIKPIGITVIKNIVVKNDWSKLRAKGKELEYERLEYKPIRELFPHMDYITVSQNKDRPFNELCVLKKKLNWIFAVCKKIEFNNISYYRSRIVVMDDEQKLKEFEKRWSDQRISYVNELAEKCSVKESTLI